MNIRYIGAVGAAMLAVAVVVWILSQTDSQAPSLSPFLDGLRVRSMPDNRPASFEAAIRAETGFYLAVFMDPAADLPKVWEEREVRPPQSWPMVVCIYPRGETSNHHLASRSLCIPFEFVRVKLPRGADMIASPSEAVGANTALHQEAFGFKGVPKAPPYDKKKEVGYWCFAALTSSQPPGEYIVEIVVYPAAVAVSAVRAEAGPGHVLWRESLRRE